jgi:hypothetical protein
MCPVARRPTDTDDDFFDGKSAARGRPKSAHMPSETHARREMCRPAIDGLLSMSNLPGYFNSVRNCSANLRSYRNKEYPDWVITTALIYDQIRVAERSLGSEERMPIIQLLEIRFRLPTAHVGVGAISTTAMVS